MFLITVLYPVHYTNVDDLYCIEIYQVYYLTLDTDLILKRVPHYATLMNIHLNIIVAYPSKPGSCSGRPPRSYLWSSPMSPLWGADLSTVVGAVLEGFRGLSSVLSFSLTIPNLVWFARNLFLDFCCQLRTAIVKGQPFMNLREHV